MAFSPFLRWSKTPSSLLTQPCCGVGLGRGIMAEWDLRRGRTQGVSLLGVGLKLGCCFRGKKWGIFWHLNFLNSDCPVNAQTTHLWMHIQPTYRHVQCNFQMGLLPSRSLCIWCTSLFKDTSVHFIWYSEILFVEILTIKMIGQKSCSGPPNLWGVSHAPHAKDTVLIWHFGCPETSTSMVRVLLITTIVWTCNKSGPWPVRHRGVLLLWCHIQGQL